MSCGKLEPERLAEWVDGEIEDSAAASVVAAHVESCPACANSLQSLRSHRVRMGKFAASTTPAELPPEFFQILQARLDGIDVHRPKELKNVRLRWAVLGALAVTTAALLISLLATPRSIDLSAIHVQSAPPPGREQFVTDDPDLASRWLSARIGTEIPPLNLSLVHARLQEVFPIDNCGVLLYMDERRRRVELLIYPRAHLAERGTGLTTYGKQSYRTRESDGQSTVAWETERAAFVAASEMPLNDLLPFAHEMARRCRR